jgi:hypothetical protein
MRRTLAIAALLLTAGCDDPAVQGKVLDVLEYGFVSAQANCSVVSENSLGAAAILGFQATRFADGSAMAIANSASIGNTRFFDRNNAGIADLTVPLRISFGNNDRIEVSFDGGDIVVFEPTASPSDTPDSCAVTTCCTGFNLEAFE